MTHAASAPLSEEGRFSPAALSLAITLHVAAAAGLWWLSPLRPLPFKEDVIEVTLDKGGLPPTVETAAPAPEAQPQPTPPSPPTPPAPPQTLAMPQMPVQPEPPKEPPKEQVKAQPPEPPKEPPKQPTQEQIEQALPPLPEPLPPPTAMDFPKPAPPPPPPPPKPQPAPQQAQAPPPQPQPQPRPQQPPPQQQAAVPQPSPLRSPSDVIIGPQGASQYDYFTQMARKLAQYRYYPQTSRDRREEGRVVVRVTLARDGRLVDVRVERSSGFPAIDAAELETVKRAAPFPPLPLHMSGDRVTFLVPVHYELR